MVVELLKVLSFLLAVYAIPVWALWMWNKETPNDSTT